MSLLKRDLLKLKIHYQKLGLFGPPTPTGHFVSWCREPLPDEPERRFQLSAFLNKERGVIHKSIWQISDAVNSAIKQGKIFDLIIDAELRTQDEISFKGQLKDKPRTDIRLLRVGSTGGGSICLENLTIYQLVLTSTVPIKLINCQVARFEIGTGLPVRLISINTSIGFLSLSPTCVNHLDVAGGCILNFSCPPPGSENPFTGHVSFKSVFLPRDTKNYLLESEQPYRSLSHHLHSLHNTTATHLFHTAELVVERERSSWTDNLISYLYQGLCDFGNSILRPFLWWLLLIAVTTFIALHSEGGFVAADPESSHLGWKTALFTNDNWSQLLQAGYGAITTALNPLGIFGTKSVLVAQSPWLAAWLTITGISSAVLIALLIFAIRRRFKMQ